MKVRRKINEIDVERAIKKILAEQGITRKCLNYLAANVDELQADYITSIMGKIKQQVRPNHYPITGGCSIIINGISCLLLSSYIGRKWRAARSRLAFTGECSTSGNQ